MVFVNSLLLERMEKWLQLMLKWSPQERGKDPNSTQGNCFTQLETILALKVLPYRPSFLDSVTRRSAAIVSQNLGP